MAQIFADYGTGPEQRVHSPRCACGVPGTAGATSPLEHRGKKGVGLKSEGPDPAWTELNRG